MGEKVTTTMKLKVDLQCCKCYKKVKKVLCKFPQIRDQVYDEKNNIVTITVVCCSPEKIRDKLCCNACGAIKSIEIVEPPKPKPKPKPELPPPPVTACSPPPPPVTVCSPPPPPVTVCSPRPPPVTVCSPRPPPVTVCSPRPPPVTVCPPPPPQAPPPMAVPIRVCCGSCYEGRPGGPCFEGYGGYGGTCYGRPVYDSYGGGGRLCYVSRCDEYFCEENTSGCSIM